MKKHLGSTIALVIGALFFISGLIQLTNNLNTLSRGIIITLGALAYRSAKKQKLGEVRVSLLRKTLEIFLLVIIIVVVLLQHYKIETYPVDYLIIPLWAIIAYLVIALKKTNVENSEGAI